MRPYWHPFVTVQACGLAIAYCVNVAAPWASPRPILRLAIAVAIGAILGHALMVPIKNFILEYLLDQPRLYTLDYLLSHKRTFFFSAFGAFLIGLCISVFFLLRFREARAAEALHKAEAERLLLAKHAMESELKLMQAQIEPHFLFNTLASVQFLTETDPPQASRLLGHLLSYLRAALPKMRSASATLGQEIEFAEAYLNILQDADGAAPRLRDRRPGRAAHAPLPARAADIGRGECGDARPRAPRRRRPRHHRRAPGSRCPAGHRHRHRHRLVRQSRGRAEAWASSMSASAWRRCSARAAGSCSRMPRPAVRGRRSKSRSRPRHRRPPSLRRRRS